MSGWLCQCGNGALMGAPPEECGLCGFPLRAFLEEQDLFTPDQENEESDEEE